MGVEVTSANCPSQETEVNSTPTRPVDNVVITKGLQDRNIHIFDETTVENKGKLILSGIVLKLILFQLNSSNSERKSPYSCCH